MWGMMDDIIDRKMNIPLFMRQTEEDVGLSLLYKRPTAHGRGHFVISRKIFIFNVYAERSAIKLI